MRFIQSKSLAWLLLGICLLTAAIQGISYLSIVSSEHPYQQASKWIYANVPKGSSIVGVHWDDGLPVSLPGYNPQSYGYKREGERWELKAYDPDTQAKLSKMAEQLADADYLIFPTQRIPGSIPRIPEEYPYTTAMLQLMYSQHLGYQLAVSFKKVPKFGPLSFNTDLADESISVYDNPRVTIFKNVERLSATEIRDRIQNPSRFAPLPDLQQILSPGRVSGSDSDGMRWQVFRWLLIIGLCGYLFAPLVSVIFSQSLDVGFGFSRTFGILLVGLSCWFLGRWVKVPITGAAVAAVCVIWLILSSLVVKKCYGGWRLFFNRLLPKIIFTEGVFWGGMFLFLLLRAYQPEIFWGEKPMDSTFLHYFTRLDTLPPQDPWAAGNIMRYYYLGIFFVANWLKLCGVSPSIGYNLILATLGALLLSGSFSLLLLLLKRTSYALWGSIAMVLFSNFDVAWLAFVEKKKINFDLFWASSRTLSSPAINEYPLWSHIFADLHAHVILQPFALLLMGLLTLLVVKRDSGKDRESSWSGIEGVIAPSRCWSCAALGALLGAFIGINTWDFISYGLLTAIVFGVAFIGDLIDGEPPGETLVKYLVQGVLVAAMTLAVGLPLYCSISGGAGIHLGWVEEDEFDSFGQIIRHIGFWLLLLVLSVIPICICKGACWKNLSWRLPVSLVLGSLPLLLGAWSFWRGTREIPWSILSLISFFGVVAVFVATRKATPAAIRVASGFLYVALLLIGGAELVYLMDRMNTIFKFYNAIWLILGAGSIVYFSHIIDKARETGMLSASYRWAAISVGGIAAVICLSGSLINIQAMLRFQRIPGPRPTLNGDAYLDMANQEEASLIRWINKSITGVPVLLEAHGASYGAFTRIAMHTGLPTVLGWDYHVTQRGTKREDVERRKKDISIAYNTSDWQVALRILRQYGVRYVVVGKLERLTYGSDGLAKFSNAPAAFSQVFKDGETALYRVS